MTIRCILFLTAVLVLCGCSTVEIRNAKVVETRRFGIVILKVEPQSAGAALVITKGAGLTLGTSSLTLGYLAETAVLSADLNACRVFIVVSNEAELAALTRLMNEQAHLDQLCIVQKGN